MLEIHVCGWPSGASGILDELRVSSSDPPNQLRGTEMDFGQLAESARGRTLRYCLQENAISWLKCRRDGVASVHTQTTISFGT